MRITVHHERTKEEAVAAIDRPIGELFGGLLNGLVIANERRTWRETNGPESTMDFSCHGRVGFVSVPLAGSIEVASTVVAMEFELPSAARMLLGEEKVRAGLAAHLSSVLSGSST